MFVSVKAARYYDVALSNARTVVRLLVARPLTCSSPITKQTISAIKGSDDFVLLLSAM